MARFLNHQYRLTLSVPADLPDVSIPLRTQSGVDTSIIITELQIEGSITLDKSSKNNLLKLNVYNLSEASIEAVSQENLQVVLEVGYPEQPLAELYRGSMINISTRDSGSTAIDRVTTILASDGYNQVREGQTSRTWASSSITVEDILKTLIQEDLGLAVGDIHNGDNAPGTGINYSFPTYSAVGPTYKIMDDITDGFDLEWNINAGEVDVYPRGSSKREISFIPVFSPQTGLLRSPSKVIIHPDRAKASKDKKTGKKLEVILNPTLKPGGKVDIQSKNFSERVTIQSIMHKFNFWQSSWVSHITTEDDK